MAVEPWFIYHGINMFVHGSSIVPWYNYGSRSVVEPQKVELQLNHGGNVVEPRQRGQCTTK